MRNHFGSFMAGLFIATPLAAQVPRIPQAPLPPPKAAITNHCADDTGCPFPGAIVPEHTNAAPDYPMSLRQAGVTGTVRINFSVTPDGMVQPGSVRVVSASNPELGAAASATVANWEFHLLGSHRRASTIPVRLTVEYALDAQCTGDGTATWAADRRNPRVVVTGCR